MTGGYKTHILIVFHKLPQLLHINTITRAFEPRKHLSQLITHYPLGRCAEEAVRLWQFLTSDLFEGFGGLVGRQLLTLVLLEGRRRRWTSDLRARFVAAGVAMDRVHFLPRTAAGDEYLHVLNIADVVLHPFPFGGSRTSAEGEAH